MIWMMNLVMSLAESASVFVKRFLPVLCLALIPASATNAQMMSMGDMKIDTIYWNQSEGRVRMMADGLMMDVTMRFGPDGDMIVYESPIVGSGSIFCPEFGPPMMMGGPGPQPDGCDYLDCQVAKNAVMAIRRMMGCNDPMCPSMDCCRMPCAMSFNCYLMSCICRDMKTGQ